MHRLLVVILGCALLAPLATGCSVSIGESDSLDTQELETTIADSQEKQLGFRPVIECPEDVEAAEGDEFTCKATAPDGTTATVFVTQTDGEGDVTWRVVADQDGGGTTTGP